MHMIPVGADLQELELIASLDPQTDVSQRLVDRRIEHGSSIFGWKHQVVEQNRNVMALVDVEAHPRDLRRKRRGMHPKGFKHALVRDAAHESLLKTHRQELHARIVQALEECFPETVDTEPELLAQHCVEAGLAEQAVDYWYRAGQRAVARSATAEAVAQLTRGRDLLKTLPDTPKRRQQELDLQVALGGVL